MGRQAVVVSHAPFFWGSLRHKPLLEAVLGRPVTAEPAWVHGFSTVWAPFGDFALLLPTPGARCEGIMLRDCTAKDSQRLGFFERGFGFDIDRLQAEDQAGQRHAVEAYLTKDQDGRRDGDGRLLPWNFEDWVKKFGDEFEATFRDFMTHMGLKRPTAVAARQAQMMVRGASRVRARKTAPTTLRFHATSGDVEIAETRDPYARFFSVEEIDVSYRLFDGTMSPKVTRAGFVSCDAVTVLPYDVARDRVLVVEQFRTGPYLRGDAQPWQIEAIAGRIDPGEAPIAAALRETAEEAGLDLNADQLLLLASYYPSPGIMSEFLYSYVALTNLPDGCAGVFGLEGEAEDIRGHLLDFDAFMALVGSGEVANAPTLLTAHWLALNRARLRAEAGL